VKPNENNSFKPKTTEFSKAADEDIPAPPGIFPLKAILKLPIILFLFCISATTPKT